MFGGLGGFGWKQRGAKNAKSAAKPKPKAKLDAKAKSPAAKFRRAVRWTVAAAALGVVVLSGTGNWFVHHPPEWIFQKEAALPRFLTAPLEWFGYRTGDITDAIGWTGSDVVFEIDESTDPDPEEPMFFARAGAPRRRGAPAPEDIEILKRDHFAVGWSPSLRRPVWVAYHVTPEVKYPEASQDRPRSFRRDENANDSPAPGEYTNSGYDRGHMAPNHAIASRYGKPEQEKTFLMSNVAPQSPGLNQGPWQNLEMRIADLWAERYGEIWVIVGAVPGKGRGRIGGAPDAAADGDAKAARRGTRQERRNARKKAKKRKNRPSAGVDVPEGFFQIIIARKQTEDEAAQTIKSEVRVLAVWMPQDIARGAYYTRNIVSVKDIESLTGLEFFPELDRSVSERLLADRATRLWPTGFSGIFKLIAARFRRY